MTDTMRQEAPYPEILADLVERLRYRPGWKFDLEDLQRDEDHGRGEARGLTFTIYADTMDAYHPDRHRPVRHYFAVPAATYDERSWRRWLLDCLLKVETHEACEHFVVMETHRFVGSTQEIEVPRRPYAPVHAPGADPHVVTEVVTDLERRTSFRGTVNE